MALLLVDEVGRDLVLSAHRRAVVVVLLLAVVLELLNCASSQDPTYMASYCPRLCRLRLLLSCAALVCRLPADLPAAAVLLPFHRYLLHRCYFVLCLVLEERDHQVEGVVRRLGRVVWPYPV